MFEKITQQTIVAEKTEKTLEKTQHLLQHMTLFIDNFNVVKKNQTTKFGLDLLENPTKIAELRKLFVEESTRIQLVKLLLK